MSGLILMTGATGFVGRQVQRALIERDKLLRVVVREGKSDRFNGIPEVESVVTSKDIFQEDADWWEAICQGVDIVVHLAWYAEPGKYLQSALNLDCLAGTLQLAKGSARAGVRRFVGIGTCFEYDHTSGYLSVNTPLRPLSPYAGAKAAAFMALSQWLPAKQIEFAWCRLFYLYGEGEDERRFVPYLRARLVAGEAAELTSGNQVRDFLDVAEAGRLIASTVLSHDEGPVNICSECPMTVREMAEHIADEYGRRDLLKFGMRPDNYIDPPFLVGVRN